MILQDLFESTTYQYLVVFPGGFHPFSPAHLHVVKTLRKQFPHAAIYCASTDSTTERPFSFEQKKFLAAQAGFPPDQFIQVKNPYKADEITGKFGPNKTILIYAMGAKDAGRIKPTKKDGSLSYLQPYPAGSASAPLEPFSARGYVVTVPTVSYKLMGQEITSASKIREMYAKASAKDRMAIVRQLYPKSKKVNEIKQIFDSVLGQVNESNQIKSSSIPETFYHGTFQPYLKSIMAKGLGAYYPGKNYGDSQGRYVYLADSPELSRAFCEEADVPEEYLDQIVILSIDSNKLNYRLLQHDSNILPVKAAPGFGLHFHSWEYTGIIPPDAITILINESVDPAFFKPIMKTKVTKEIPLKQWLSLKESPDFEYSKFNDRDKNLRSLTWKIESGGAYGISIAAGEGTYTSWDDRNLYGRIRALSSGNQLKIISAKIKPEWHGTGLGQMLYDKLIQTAKKEGYKYIYSDVDRSESANKAWKRLAQRYPVAYDKTKYDSEGTQTGQYIIPLERVKLKEAWRGDRYVDDTGLGQMLYDKAIELGRQKGYKCLKSDSVLRPDGEKAWQRLAKRYPVRYNEIQKRYFLKLNESSAPIKFHKELNPILWEDGKLKGDVRKHLLEMADYFIADLDLRDLDVKDIELSGSNAAYTYANGSDIDLHVVISVPEEGQEFYRDYFDTKKNLFNDIHELHIGPLPVELYVQFADQPHISNGVYSVLRDEWLKEPVRQKANFNERTVRVKTHYFAQAIADAVKHDNIEKADKLWKRIKAYRKEGLTKTGELGSANIVFKMLRSSGLLEILSDFRRKHIDKELSLEHATF